MPFGILSLLTGLGELFERFGCFGHWGISHPGEPYRRFVYPFTSLAGY